ncbi:MAG: hypothetical protein OEN20_08050 [Gammaproteobacteria bacterium]|nr:hypothetical protein [Gammaproteobacteria bacterium]
MSLTRSVAAAVDAAFTHQRLQEFGRLKLADAMSIRRYYRKAHAVECEISVYRDKWWNKSGGSIFLELYCLEQEVQQLLGGCPQSWLRPDYAQPLRHFQYSLGRSATRNEWKISSADDVAAFGPGLQDFLLAEGLHWFAQFDSREGVIGYLQRERAHATLAELHARLGNDAQALQAFNDFLHEYPRDIETELYKMASVGIIDDQECRVLLRGSLQKQSDYASCVEQWCLARGI